MKRKWIFTIIAILLIFGLTIGFLGRKGRRGIEVKTTTVVKGNLVSYLSTNGTIESKTKRDYYMPTPQKVVRVRVQVGESVKSGDIIVEFEVPDMTIQLKTAQIQYDNAKLQLDNLKRQKNNIGQLQNQGAAGSQNQGQLPQISGTGGMNIDDQIRLQENQVELARLNLESVKNAVNKQQKYIKADFDGMVTAVNVTEGGYSTVQLPAVTIEDNSNLRVNININQYDVSRISKGQTAVIRFVAKEFKGRVDAVNPVASKVMSATGTDTVIKAMVDVLENDGTLKPGFDVDIDIRVGEKNDTLKIPSEAIVTDKEGRERVYIVENGVVRIRNIDTGLSSDIEEEVLSGLNPGEKVILNPSSTLKDGDRVIEKGEAK